MDQINQIILSLGSNLNKESNMGRAVVLLQSYFEIIRFSDAAYTEPIGCSHGAELYLNCVAIASTSLSVPKLNRLLKQIESVVGRRPEDKASGWIPIDIDLIQWNEVVLKPDDLSRDYVVQALAYLTNREVPVCRKQKESD